jgi:hypothetical protein
MREIKRDQIAFLSIVIILFLLSLLLVTNVNSLLAPVGANVNFNSGNSTSPSSNADGLLVITVESNLTVIPTSEGPVSVGNSGLLNSPLRGVQLSISERAPSISRGVPKNPITISNSTNSNGEFGVYLPPGTYNVGFLDWRMNDSVVSVTVYPAQTTHLGSYLNATTFPVESFNIVDPDSSGWILGWGQMFALVPGEQNVTSNDGAFIETGSESPTAYLTGGNPSGISSVSIVTAGTPPGITPVSISGSIANQNSEWLSIKVGSPVAIAAIHSLRLLSLNDIFLVSTG